MSTLYRKYRPQTFADIIDQEHIVQTVTNEIKLNKVAQAYLFSGPRGVGKTTLARLIAKAVNCQKRKDGAFEPCESCTSCEEITRGRSIDVIEIDAASQTGVDNVRENIIENAQFKPTSSKFKVFIIDEVHMLSTSAFNALLKTLEEPPAHVIFILATTELHKLPATIVSRCQRFTFKKIAYQPMLAKLQKICIEEKVKVETEVLDRVINKSDGCLRDAESLLGQILSLNLKKITAADTELILPTSNAEDVVGFLESVLKHNAADAIALLNTQVESGANLDQFAYDLLELLRTIMIVQATQDAKRAAVEYSEKVQKKIKNISDTEPALRIIALIDGLLLRRAQIKTSPLPHLPLELFAVGFASDRNADVKSAGNAVPPAKTSDTRTIVEDSSAKNTTKTSEPPAHHTITESIKSVVNHITHHVELTTNLDQIKQKWNDLVVKIDSTNHSLTFILKMCSLKEVAHGGVMVSLPYSLHKEKLEEPKNRAVVESALEEMFGEKIKLFCSLEASEPAPASENDELSSLAVAFGGEVVG